MKNCKIIFVGNYKGGVGKTTTVINLAQYMAEKGKRVLTLDLDPQSSLSEIQVEKINNKNSSGMSLSKLPDDECLNYVFDLLINKINKYPSLKLDFSSNKLIKTFSISNNVSYDFIPSSIFYRNGLGLDSLAIMMKNNIEYLSLLKNYVDTIKSNYNYIIIDCPPSNNLITQSAFLMSDYYIIPTILDRISTDGVIHYIRTVNQIYKDICIESEDALIAKHYFGEKPNLLGVFFNLIRGQVNYEAERKRMEELMQMDNESNVFKSKVNNYVAISRNAQNGMMAMSNDDFKKLCDEIMMLLEND